ncbi:MAG: SDR family oxidoreductase [Chloroflexota bacterium]|nr:SDR family oxidoreductase [Chloroflexota bacterium]
MASRFDGKVIVITGAAGGIGRATAARFAGEGARVVLVDLAGAPLDEAVAAVEGANGLLLVVQADVTRSEDVARYVAEAVSRFGTIDGFFNNAGIEGAVAPLVDYPEDVFDRVIAVNLKGVWLGMKHVALIMRERGGGAIVNISSIAGLRGSRNLIAYSASKHAVVGLTRSAALELAPYSIRVNAVCPAPIETRMMRALETGINPADPAAAHEQFISRSPVGRYGEPEEVAALVAFLCSPDASYINGGIYPVDGAWTA